MASGVRTTNVPRAQLLEVLGHYDAGGGKMVLGRSNLSALIDALRAIISTDPTGVAALRSDLNALSGRVDGKPAIEDVQRISTQLAAAIEDLQAQILDADTAIDGKAGIVEVQALTAQLGAAVADLQQQILAVGRDAVSGLASKAASKDVQAINTTAVETAAALQKQILAAFARLDSVEGDKVDRDDLVTLSQAVSAQRLAYLRRAGRPGDDPSAFVFCATLADLARAPDLPPLPAALVAVSDNGAVIRMTGAGIIAARWGYALEPGRVLGLRAVLQRRSSVADPAGNGVRFGVAWLDQAGGPVQTKPFDVVKDLLRLGPSDGRVEIATTVARGPGKSVLLRAPYGARFAVPFVEAFGNDGLPDIEVLDGEDASRAVLLPPVSQDLVARVDGIEAQDLPQRLVAVESATQNPASLTFATVGDARAASIAASVSTLSVRGAVTPGDARGASYRRVSQAVAAAGLAGASFQSKDGAWWLRVDGSVRDADLSIDATNFTVPLSGAEARHYRGKLGEVAASPFDFVSRVVAGDWAPAISAAAAAAASAFRRLTLDGVFVTRSPITLPGNLHLTGKSYLLGRATTPQECMVRITGGNLHVDGSIEANAGYSTLYDQAYLVVGDQVQYLRTKGLNAVGAQVAFCIGTRDKPAALLSESNVAFGHSYGCPGVMRIISVEGYLSIVDPIFSADSLGGNAAWDALPKFALEVIGARVAVRGGHVESTSGLNGILLKGEPLLASHQGLVWPQIDVDGPATETAMPLVRMHNPRGLTGPNNTNRRGSVSIRGIGGAHSQDREAFIQADADFAGDIFYAADNRVWVGVSGYNRARPNIQVENPDAQIYVERDAFSQEQGFQHWMAGTKGGTVRFGLCQIARAFGLAGQAFTAGQRSTLLFKTPDGTTGVYQRFLDCYDPATGRFTIPRGGLNDVAILVRLAVLPRTGVAVAALTGRLYLFEDTTPVDEIGVVNGYGTLMYRRGALPAGRVLTAQFQPDANCSGHDIATICALTVEASK